MSINKRNQNISSLNTQSSSAGKNNSKIISQNTEKNSNDLNTYKNSINMSNSHEINSDKLAVKIKDNKYSTKNAILLNSSLINIDNIDESAYNPDPFILPKKKFSYNMYISKVEYTIINYNAIKENINKKILDQKLPNKTQILQSRNFFLLEQLDKLNSILDTMVERKRISRKNNNKENKGKNELYNNIINNSNKNGDNYIKNLENFQSINRSSKDNKKQLLQNIKKQYNILSDKYKELANDYYIQKIKEETFLISSEIKNVEETNRKLKTEQFKAEYALKNYKYSKNDLSYKKKVDEYSHLNNEYQKIMRKIPQIEDYIKNNKEKINQLNENKNDLIKIAKETYNLNNPEEQIKNIKDNSENRKSYIRKRELEQQIVSMNTRVNKLEYKRKENIKNIKKLEENKAKTNSLLKLKTEILDELNKQLNDLEQENYDNEIKKPNYKKINLDEKDCKNNLNKISSLKEQTLKSAKKPLDINDNETKDITKNEIPIDLNSINNRQNIENNYIGESSVLNNRYNNDVINKNKNNSIKPKNISNNKAYNKKMILEQLDIQKNQENIKLDKSINLKKNKLKPNFSFSLNDMNLKEKKMNHSVALKPKIKNKDRINEIEGEIKEDIEINNNINEDKMNTENKEENPKIVTNLSQNISMEKFSKEADYENKEGKIRKNDLNTVPYDVLEKDEKKIKNSDENYENYNFANSYEQEHNFENEQINFEDNQNDNLNMN